MSNRKKLLYIGGGRDILETLRIAKNLNIEIHYIQKPELFNENVNPLVHKVYLLNYEDDLLLENLIIPLHAKEQFHSVYSLNETALITAAKARDLLGLPGNSLKTTQILRDKMFMRQHLFSNHFSYVRSQIGRSAQDIKDFFNFTNTEIIIKPINGSGSYSIFKMKNLDNLIPISQALQTNGVQQFIMEEFLHGPEYSVESFSQKGVHKIITVTEKRILPNFVEVGHTLPAEISEKTKLEIEDFIQSFLHIIELQDGPTHTEVILTSNGPKIIESHDRTGGDKINDLVRLSFGLDMKEMAFRQAVGEDVFSGLKIEKKRSASIAFLTAEPGRILEIRGLDLVINKAGVEDVFLYLKENDLVSPIKDSLDRAGYIIATGANSEESKKIAFDGCLNIQIITKP